MSDSKTFQRTESASEIAPERVDQAHRSLGNSPHVQFGPTRPDAPGSDDRSSTSPVSSGGRSTPHWTTRSPGPAAAGGDPPGLPSKLQVKMDRLLADLAALEEPESDAFPLSFRVESASEGLRSRPEPVRSEETSDAQGDKVQGDKVQGGEKQAMGDEEAEACDHAAVAVGEGLAWEAVREESTHRTELMLAADRADEVVGNAGVAVALDADPVLVAEASGAFSRQARGILDILKRRQEQLSYQKNELELREAALEKQMRQERLALVERQRQLQELEAQAPRSAGELSQTFPTWPTVGLRPEVPGVSPADSAVAPSAAPSVTAPDLRGERRITPEWIAAHERQAHGEWDESRTGESQGDLIEGCEEHQDTSFYSVIEEYVQRQVQQAHGLAALAVAPSPAAAAAVKPQSPSVGGNASGLQRQAQQLRQQHETAIRAMQQTRRQLELLKDILVQQQQQWAVEVNRLAGEQQEWQETRGRQLQQWTSGLEEIDRLRVIEQHESAKRATFLDQREAAIQALEGRQQQTQVDILRDRVVLKQLERTVRQTLSNADWNQRWQIISEETQGYLKKVHQDAETLQAAAKRKLERLESRQSEMLLYRESLRNWIERQMKLVSRRVAHGEDRQQSVQTQWEAVQVARRELQSQQAALNECLSASLLAVDQRLQPTPPYRADQEAA